MASDDFADGGTCAAIVNDPGSAIDALAPPARPELAAPHSVHDPDTMLIEVDGRRFTVAVHDPATSLPLPPPVRARSAIGTHSGGNVLAPIPGNVLKVLVEPGQVVAAGEVVCILEAMKMENEIAAHTDGTVEKVSVSAGDAVAAGQHLVSISA
jgi:biotin carboxyl carrier protein